MVWWHAVCPGRSRPWPGMQMTKQQHHHFTSFYSWCIGACSLLFIVDCCCFEWRVMSSFSSLIHSILVDGVWRTLRCWPIDLWLEVKGNQRECSLRPLALFIHLIALLNSVHHCNIIRIIIKCIDIESTGHDISLLLSVASSVITQGDKRRPQSMECE